MGVIGRLKHLIRGPNDKLAAIVAALDNQSKLLDTTLHGLVQGMDNQSRMLSQRLDRLIQGMDNQSRMLSERLDRLIQGMDNQDGPSRERPTSTIQGALTEVTMPAADRARVIMPINAGPASAAKQAIHAWREFVLPDYAHGTLQPEEFRDVILRRGAVMLRKAADPYLLDQIRQKIDGLFAHYATAPWVEHEAHPASSDPVNYDDFWSQLKRSHIFDRAFRQFSGLSYFDIIRDNGLWDLAASAFHECQVTESADCNCRRTTIGDLKMFFDAPIDFHVDAQYHFIHQLSINFWTPLTACGKNSPGIKVVLLGEQETKDYLEFDEAGYAPEPGDIDNMRHFRCNKMRLDKLQEHELAKYLWAPEFEKGDILAFTNFTMHATHYLPEMTQPRTSVEVRISLPAARH
jgi:hypothetical protein